MPAAATHAACALPGTPLEGVRAGIDTCVHCGFCLQACPTYLALEDENDSPRGRILLMRALWEGEIPLSDPTIETHIDRCLGCRACETACPSGVPYGQLLEATRATMTAARPVPLVARLVLWTFRKPLLLAIALFFSRLLRASDIPRLLSRLPGRLGFAMGMLASTSPLFRARPYTRRASDHRGDATLLEGCVMRGLFTHTHDATRRTLAANGYRVVETPKQRCCGALHAHAGQLEEARELARRNIEAFERTPDALIVINAAGCGAMMKEYAHLLANDPAWAERARQLSARVRDVSEVLVAAGPQPGGALDLHITYDAPCHLLHAQRIARPPLAVLEAVPGLRMTPLVDADQCCGSAGIYTLLEPELAGRVLAPKLRNIAETGADVVATGNPGCLMQIGAGLLRQPGGTRAVHPVEILDASYAADTR